MKTQNPFFNVSKASDKIFNHIPLTLQEMTPEKGDIVQLREGFNGWAGLLTATVASANPFMMTVNVPGHGRTAYTITIADVKAILYTAKDDVFHC